MKSLLQSPVFLRELRLRASRHESCRLYNYSGPGLFLLLCTAPIMFGWMLTDGPSTNDLAPFRAMLFMGTLWLLVLYFSHSAARFCAGSFAAEKERGTLEALRLLPRPPRDLFLAKFVAAVAPLALEALMAPLLLSPYAWAGVVAWPAVIGVAPFALALVVFFGLWGMFWSIQSRDVVSALSRAFGTVLAWNAVPLAGACAGSLMDPQDAGAIFLVTVGQVSPVYFVTTWLTRVPAPLEPFMLPATMVLACLVLLSVGLALWRGTIERLRRG